LPVKTKNNQNENLVEGSNGHLQTAAKNAYNDQKAQAIDDGQITQYIPMVHKIVSRVVSYIKPPLSYEDLVSAGTIGLVKAARDYDPAHQAEFKTYAYIRIRGAILDELRSFSFLPSAVSKQIRQATQMSLEITEEKGEVPTNEELAEKMQMPVNKLYQIFENARARQFLSLDISTDGSPSLGHSIRDTDTTPADKQLEKEELIKRRINRKTNGSYTAIE
jgi:RNA polymerase sigma factor for flagellar operon FliA